MKKLVIEGNFVFETGVKRAQVTVDKVAKKILKIDYSCTETPDNVYGEQVFIFPGMGDIHVHTRSDASKDAEYKEDFFSASLAATNGGITFIADMPNNKVSPTTLKLFKEKQELVIAAKSEIPIFIYGAIGPGTVPFGEEILYKVYMSHSVGGISFTNYETLEETLKNYKGLKVSFHCEDPKVLEASKNEKSFYNQRPPKAEISAIKKAIELIDKFNLVGVICHVSTKKGAELLLEAKSKGVNVKFEVTPQHLYFSQEKIEEDGLDPVQFQMNPPIRRRVDQQFLFELFKKGEIDFLATDHAPHTKKEKQAGVSGLTGLDTYGPFCTLLLYLGVPAEALLKSCSKNPAAHVGLKDRGAITVTGSSIFTLLKLNEELIVNDAYLKTKSSQSVWEHITFPGRSIIFNHH